MHRTSEKQSGRKDAATQEATLAVHLCAGAVRRRHNKARRLAQQLVQDVALALHALHSEHASVAASDSTLSTDKTAVQ